MNATLPSWPWFLALAAASVAYVLAARAKVAFRFLSPVALEALVAKLGPERTHFLRKSLRGPTPFWFSLHVASTAALVLFVVVLFAGDVGFTVLGHAARLRPTGRLLDDSLLFASLFVVAVLVEFFLPVVLARADPEQFLERSLPIIGAVHWVLSPLTRALARWSAQYEESEEETKEEEVDAFIDVGTREGIIAEDEGEIVRNLVTFGDTRVREIMTARTDIVGMESSATVKELVQLMAKTRFSRIPLHSGQLDDVVGLVTLKDAVAALEEGRGEQSATTLMHRPFIVPGSKRVAELLRDFQASRQQLAIVDDA